MARKPIFKTPSQEVQVQYKYSDRNDKGIYHTHNGHKISAKEELFIQNIVKGKTPTEAAKAIGSPGKGAQMIAKKAVAEEIDYRFGLMKDESIATGKEIMQYYTRVMRGEEKDQFGLDAPLGERTSAARELMKRVVEIEEKAEGNSAPEVKITLNFDREDGKNK